MKEYAESMDIHILAIILAVVILVNPEEGIYLPILWVPNIPWVPLEHMFKFVAFERVTIPVLDPPLSGF